MNPWNVHRMLRTEVKGNLHTSVLIRTLSSGIFNVEDLPITNTNHVVHNHECYASDSSRTTMPHYTFARANIKHKELNNVYNTHECMQGSITHPWRVITWKCQTTGTAQIGKSYSSTRYNDLSKTNTDKYNQTSIHVHYVLHRHNLLVCNEHFREHAKTRVR